MSFTSLVKLDPRAAVGKHKSVDWLKSANWQSLLIGKAGQ